MKTMSVLLAVLGILSIFLGLIPFIIPFPTNNLEASGPQNLWEVLIYLAYDGKGWYLAIGILMLLMGLFFRAIKK